jgi:phage/plasmid-like protein (TIGR03299 family)
MPHEVESMVYVDQKELAATGVPWHGLGVAKQAGGWLTDAEVAQAIGFDVHTQPLYRKNVDGLFAPVDDAQETVRSATDTHIGTVGSDYTVFLGQEMVELGSILVNDWGAKWDTAAVLKEGRIIFATIRLDELNKDGRGLAGTLDDSDYYRWFLLGASHDGSHGLSGDIVRLRTVCANTFAAGRNSAKTGWSIRHTGNISDKAREAHRLVGLVTAEDKQFDEFSQKLAESVVALEEFDDFAEALFPTSKKKVELNGASEEEKETLGAIAQSNAKAKQEAVKANWLRSETIPEPLRFTGWGLLNATTEWAEHQRVPRNDPRVRPNERRMLSTLYGGPISQIRQKASTYLVKAADHKREVKV